MAVVSRHMAYIQKVGSLAVVATLMLGVAACGDGLAPNTGTYELIAINGSAVPATMSNGTRITSGTLVLNGDHTFSSFLSVCTGWPNVCSSGHMDGKGSWKAAGSVVTFTNGTTGFYANGTVKWFWSRDTLEFRR